MQNIQYCKIGYTLIFNILLYVNLFAQAAKLPNEKRGVVIYHSDITSLGALNGVDLLIKNNINLIGIHTDTRLEPLTNLESFLKSSEGKSFLEACKKYGIGVEYELHALLPRSLFNKHPEYFRIDEKGSRQLNVFSFH